MTTSESIESPATEVASTPAVLSSHGSLQVYFEHYFQIDFLGHSSHERCPRFEARRSFKAMEQKLRCFVFDSSS